MSMEQVVAAMPKAINSSYWEQEECCRKVFREAVKAQCLLLAKLGWRKVCFCDPLYSGEEHCSGFCAELHDMGYRRVPSVMKMATKLDKVLPLCKDYIDPIDSLAKVICRWQLEGE